MQESKHVLGLLQEAKKAVKTGDVAKIKSLSNQTIHSASIYQDEDNILVAIVLYSLSKLIERKEYYSDREYSEFLSFYLNSIDKAILSIKNNDSSFKNHIQEIMNKADSLSQNLKSSVQDLFRKARINKASKVYEHGISMQKTASLLGISLWELAEYAGQANISEMPLTMTMDIKKRLNRAMELFEK